MTGKIKRFDQAKGFGFIDDGSGRDVFFHSTHLVDTNHWDLNEGREVSFTLVEERGKREARNVTLLESYF